jgi:hypothetical protein
VDAHIPTVRRPVLFVPVRVTNFLPARDRRWAMRDEEEIREQYEFMKNELDDEDMNHEGVRQMFTYYKRALGWVLEEEYI